MLNNRRAYKAILKELAGSNKTAKDLCIMFNVSYGAFNSWKRSNCHLENGVWKQDQGENRFHIRKGW